MAIRRMSDMGKLPTSAWLHIGALGLGDWVREACANTPSPRERATWMVERITRIHRIGRKLAALYVSALCAEELTPGFAPWSPELDGSHLFVIDTNVSQVVAGLRRSREPQTYRTSSRWLAAAATAIDLSSLRDGLPRSSPRLVQQAAYVFKSKSNRIAMGDACATRPCQSCPSRLCPFAGQVQLGDRRVRQALAIRGA